MFLMVCESIGPLCAPGNHTQMCFFVENMEAAREYALTFNVFLIYSIILPIFTQLEFPKLS